jgi:gamma-glutamylcyclotransferase (GGCT)/AIG2-like uncharacterized protein YtfP
MKMITAHLLVYGTLRPVSGHPMARFLAERGRLLGGARVQGRLYDLAWYPGLVGTTAADEWVQGDLYELTDPEATLADLDRYEIDASARFERCQVPVVRDSQEQLTAWVYFYRGEVREEQRIASGDYLRRGG